MVLAWEAKLTAEQRKTLKVLYKRTNLNIPGPVEIKMMQLMTQSKARNTIKSYESVIGKWKKYCEIKGCINLPAEKENLSTFIAELAVKKEPLSTFLKLSPALVFYHEANGVSSNQAVLDPFVKLILQGAKREASARKAGVVKADTVSPEVVHQMIDKVMWKGGTPGEIGPAPNLADWRTATRLYTYYKTFCR